MRKVKTNILLSMVLVILSAGLYVLQLNIFHASRDTAFYLLQDMAFLPLQVAIVTVVLGKLIDMWNKRDRLRKVNMAVAAFFSEAGTELLVKLSEFANNIDGLRPNLEIGMAWGGTEYARSRKAVKAYELEIAGRSADLEALKTLLVKKRDFMLRMLENPNLLEHDTFTDMLLAVFHMTEELIAREDLTVIPGPDCAHLVGDITRALRTLLIQWISHMEHLASEYPYLYSLEVRRNPFSESNNVMFRE